MVNINDEIIYNRISLVKFEKNLLLHVYPPEFDDPPNITPKMKKQLESIRDLANSRIITSKNTDHSYHNLDAFMWHFVFLKIINVFFSDISVDMSSLTKYFIKVKNLSTYIHFQ